MNKGNRKKIFSIDGLTSLDVSTIFKGVIFLMAFFILFNLLGKISLKSTYASPPSAVPETAPWQADGIVRYVSPVYNGKMYLAGNIGFFGPQTGNAYAYNKSTSAALSSFPKNLFFSVDKIISDGSGGWYVGGYYQLLNGNSSLGGLIHVLSDGSVDPNFNPQAAAPDNNPVIYDMILSGGVLYVAGQFDSIGGASRGGLAALDPATGTATSWDPNTGGGSGGIYDIEISGDTMYIGGYFTTFAGQSRGRLAAIQISTGDLLSWAPSTSAGFPADVRSIQANGSVVYLGGSFSDVSGSSRNGLAVVDATTGAVLSWDPNPTAFSTIYTIKLVGSSLYVGGTFTNIGATTRHGLARFDATTASSPTLDSWDPAGSTTVQVRDMVSDGTDLYISGYFDGTIGGQTRRHIAGINMSTGLSNSFAPPVSFAAGSIRTIAVDGSNVYIGNIGYDLGAGGFQSTSGIVEFDPATGVGTKIMSLSSDWVPEIYDIVVDGSTMYIGGNFLWWTINGVTRSYFAAVDMNTWQFTSWDPQVSRAVRDIEIKDDYIYVGGEFAGYLGGIDGNTDIWYLARFNKNTHTLDATWIPDMYDQVNSIAVSADGSILYIGGKFDQIGSDLRDRVAAISTVTALPTAWNPNVSGGGYSRRVDKIILSGTTLYVAGNFTVVDGETRNNIAALDTTVNSGIVTSFDPNADSEVTTMSIDNGTLYFGGWFSNASGQTRSGLASVNLTTGIVDSWAPIFGENGYLGGTDNIPYSLYAYGGAVFVGGDFQIIGASSMNSAYLDWGTYVPRQYFAQFGTFTPPSTPTVAFSSTAGSGAESVANPTITVALSATSASDVTVNYTVTGTASGGGVDYTLANGTATITAGNLSTTLPLVITNDSDVEPDETVIITLSSPSNATLGTNTVYTYTITNDDIAPTPTPSSPGGSSGGGNGPIVGTLPSGNKNSIKINGNATSTKSPSVTLTITTGPEVKEMMISNSPNFKSSKKEPVVSEKKWDLCTASNCPPGVYSVFGKFFDVLGNVTDTVSSTITLTENPNIQACIEVTPQLSQPQTIFTKDLDFKQSDVQVKALQIFLNINGFIVSKTGEGSIGHEGTYFGPGTKNALNKFQTVYKKIIEAYFGDIKKFGELDKPTRDFINSLAQWQKTVCTRTEPPLPEPIPPPILLPVPPSIIVTPLPKPVLPPKPKPTVPPVTPPSVKPKPPVVSPPVPVVVPPPVIVPTTSPISSSTEALPSTSTTTNSTSTPLLPDTNPQPPVEESSAQEGSGFEQIIDTVSQTVTDVVQTVLDYVPGGSTIKEFATSVSDGAIFVFGSILPLDLASLQLPPSVSSPLLDNIETINTVTASVIVPVATAFAYSIPIQEKVIRIFTFKDLLLELSQAFHGLFALIGIRKKRRYWGTVYDSKNKQPIDPAIVQLIDAKTGAVVEEAITDMAGRFGFLTRTGTFFIRAEKTHYVFPSKIIDGQTDEIFDNVYHGETFTVSDTSQIIAPNIPMDAEAFDWNQLDKRRVITFHPRWEYVLSLLGKSLFWIGFAISLVVYGLDSTPAHTAIIMLYIAIFIVSELLSRIRLWGRILDLHGMPIPDLTVELSSPKFNGVVIGKARSASDGKFFLKAMEGEYVLTSKMQDEHGELMPLDAQKVRIKKVGVYNKDIKIKKA